LIGIFRGWDERMDGLDLRCGTQQGLIWGGTNE
jgi:hypothetical protein